MNTGPYLNADWEEYLRNFDIIDPITENELHNMSAEQGTPQIHADCAMIATQVNQ